jgi:hypothetical protein
MPLDGLQVRRTLLEICNEFEPRGSGYFQAGGVLREIAQRLNVRSTEDQQAILTVWSDLFRAGILADGYNLDNPNPPFMHLTSIGRRTLQHLSRDPYNPDGYLAAVRPHLANFPIAHSYIEEGVRAFQAGCFKSTAVMVGAAAESLVLSVRDTLVARMTAQAIAIPAALNNWQVRTVRDTIERETENRRNQLPRPLYERFAGYWMSISDQMRIARNDAGHPNSVDPVTHDTVHGNLLQFPAFAELVNELSTWISSSLT